MMTSSRCVLTICRRVSADFFSTDQRQGFFGAGKSSASIYAVTDIAVFVLTTDVKLQPTNLPGDHLILKQIGSNVAVF